MVIKYCTIIQKESFIIKDSFCIIQLTFIVMTWKLCEIYIYNIDSPKNVTNLCYDIHCKFETSELSFSFYFS